jgi:hypothetical protein
MRFFLPDPGTGSALERPDYVGSDPTSIEVPLLRHDGLLSTPMVSKRYYGRRDGDFFSSKACRAAAMRWRFPRTIEAVSGSLFRRPAV